MKTTSKMRVQNCAHCGMQVRAFRLDNGKTVTCELDPVPFRQDMREKGTDRLVTGEGHLIYCETIPDDYETLSTVTPHGYAYPLHYLHCRGYAERNHGNVGIDKG